jgi:hypothetical protein
MNENHLNALFQSMFLFFVKEQIINSLEVMQKQLPLKGESCHPGLDLSHDWVELRSLRMLTTH